jgi:hypothetical protein
MQWPAVVRTVVLGVTVLLLAGAAAVWLLSHALERLDAKYVPVVAACITGGATLLSVAVAARVLWFQQQAQRNPVQLELYKKQLDVLREVVETAAAVEDPLWLLYITREQVAPDKTNELLSRLVNLTELLRKYNVYLPKAVHDAAADLGYCAARAAATAEREGVTWADRKEPEAQCRQALEYFINTCRHHAGTDELTQGFALMIGATDPDAPQRELFRHELQHGKGGMDAWMARVEAALDRPPASTEASVAEAKGPGHVGNSGNASHQNAPNR